MLNMRQQSWCSLPILCCGIFTLCKWKFCCIAHRLWAAASCGPCGKVEPQKKKKKKKKKWRERYKIISVNERVMDSTTSTLFIRFQIERMETVLYVSQTLQMWVSFKSKTSKLSLKSSNSLYLSNYVNAIYRLSQIETNWCFAFRCSQRHKVHSNIIMIKQPQLVSQWLLLISFSG